MVKSMNPFESSFFFLMNDYKRRQLSNYFMNHDIYISDEHLVLHISVTEVDGYSQFLED